MSSQFRRLAVIMAGGSGERFWPLSREHRPKQLLYLTSESETMLEEAVNRIQPLCGVDGVFISTSAKLEPHIAEANAVPEGQVLAEPLRRNTLGALIWSVAELLARDFAPESSVAILTADHKIAPASDFRACVEEALELAETAGGLVTIGIRPDRPETGYGYIEADTSDPRGSGFRAASFREKPDLATAEGFIKSGSFLWNSGMFFFTLKGFRDALAETQPKAARVMDAIVAALRAHDRAAATEEFEKLPNLSIDYAVMEKASKVSVVPSRFAWDDLGAWDSLERSMPLAESGAVEQGDAIVIDSPGSIVYNDAPGVLVTVLGLPDIVVVCTGEAVLVCPKAQAQRVKEIVKAVAERKGS